MLTELEILKQLLGDDNKQLNDFLAAQEKCSRCPSTSCKTAMERSYAILQTAVSKKHSAVTTALEKSPENKSNEYYQELAEYLMDSWGLYFYR